MRRGRGDPYGSAVAVDERDRPQPKGLHARVETALREPVQQNGIESQSTDLKIILKAA